MRVIRFAMLVPFFALTVGCGTTPVTLKYQRTQEVVASADPSAAVLVGSFADKRGTDLHWVGAIRGGYGNPVKELRTDETTSHVVEAAFADALRTRNLLGSERTARLSIEGSIEKLDCNYYMNREAHAHLVVNLVALPSRALIYSGSYRADNKEAGVGAGLFADVNHLAEFAQQALNEAIDQALADRRFLDAIASPPR